jgi:hypothetical protein
MCQEKVIFKRVGGTHISFNKKRVARHDDSREKCILYDNTDRIIYEHWSPLTPLMRLSPSDNLGRAGVPIDRAGGAADANREANHAEHVAPENNSVLHRQPRPDNRTRGLFFCRRASKLFLFSFTVPMSQTFVCV